MAIIELRDPRNDMLAQGLMTYLAQRQQQKRDLALNDYLAKQWERENSVSTDPVNQYKIGQSEQPTGLLNQISGDVFGQPKQDPFVSDAQLAFTPNSRENGFQSMNPYVNARELIKQSVPSNVWMTMAEQANQRRRTEADKVINKEKIKNAVMRLSQAKTPQEAAGIALENDIDPKFASAMAPDKPKWNVVSTQNGTLLLVDQNGNIQNAGNYAKPEKPENPFKSGDGMIYDARTGKVVYTKPTTDKSATQQTAEFKSLAVAHNQWMKNNSMKIMGGELTEENSPYWGRMMSIMNGGSSGQQGATQSQPEQVDNSPVSQFIRQAKAEGWTKDQVINALRGKGITNYDSYVW